MLGIVLLEGATRLPAIVEKLQPTDFYTDAHRITYAAMLDLASTGGGIDMILLADELRRREQLHQVGGAPGLALLIEQASIAAHLPGYVAIVRQKAILRELIQESVQIVTDAFEAHDDVQLLVDRGRETFERIASRAIVTESVLPVMSAAELVAANIADPTFHVAGWIPTKGITFLVGDSEAYKSWFAMLVGFCIAAGRALFDKFPVTAAPVLILSEENGVVEDRRRIDLLARGMGFELKDLPLYIASETSFAFDDPVRYEALRAFVQERGIRMLIVDSFVRVHRREEKDAGAMNSLYMDRMKPLLRAGVDLLLLHHKRKLPAGVHPGQHQASTDNDDIRGSGDLRAAAHAVLFLKTLTDSTVIVRHNKARGFRKQEPYVFGMKDADQGGVALTFEGKPTDVLDKSGACAEAILTLLKDRGRLYRQDILKELKGKYSKKVIDPVLEKLSERGYPLRSDEHQIGRGKKRFFEFIDSAPEREAGEDTDVPF